MATQLECADHCRQWLAEVGLTYNQSSREAYARAHPGLCGSAYNVTLRGYERWLARSEMGDDLDAFATYLTPRFERATGATAGRR